jgi:hypothetical protein
MCDLTSGWRATDNELPFDIGERIMGDIIILMREQNLCASFSNESSGGKLAFKSLTTLQGSVLADFFPLS